MTIAFASEIKDSTGNSVIGTMHLFIAMLIVQFWTIPATFIFIPVANRIGSKVAILGSLAIFFGATILSYWLGMFQFGSLSLQTTTIIHFYLMAVVIGSILGSSQALSRSLFCALTPKSKSG